LIEELRAQITEVTDSRTRAQSLTAQTISDNKLLRNQIREERELTNLYRIGHRVLIQGITSLRNDLALELNGSDPEENSTSTPSQGSH
jgi:G:T-mismatch repair DNA endonuclease (very short patch repair protein)